MQTSRRNFLVAAAALAPLGLAAATARGQTAPVCADPATLPYAQKSKRRSFGYVEPSAEAGKACGACAFFTATTAGCGSCTILGGPVSAVGVCTSFARKA